MNPEIIAALVGALSGGLMSLVVFFLQDQIKAQRIFDGISLSITPPHGRSVGARVKNDSPYPIRNCWAYISLQYDADDIIDLEKSIIRKSQPYQLNEDRLCWAIAGNPTVMDICPGESQALRIADFGWLGTGETRLFMIVSEQNDSPYRVCLNANKTYLGEIKIVNFETVPKCYPIVISPQNTKNPIIIRS